MSCILKRFGFQLDQRIKMTHPKKLGIETVYKVTKVNNFHPTNNSYGCGCSYELSCEKSNEKFTLSTDKVKVVKWVPSLNSTENPSRSLKGYTIEEIDSPN